MDNMWIIFLCADCTYYILDYMDYIFYILRWIKCDYMCLVLFQIIWIMCVWNFWIILFPFDYMDDLGLYAIIFFRLDYMDYICKDSYNPNNHI